MTRRSLFQTVAAGFGGSTIASKLPAAVSSKATNFAASVPPGLILLTDELLAEYNVPRCWVPVGRNHALNATLFRITPCRCGLDIHIRGGATRRNCNDQSPAPAI